jgi:hypothetical protein
MRLVLVLAAVLTLGACGKPAESEPPRIERVTNGDQTCWRVVSDGGWAHTDWKCEKAN